MILGGGFLIAQAAFRGAGAVYVTDEPVETRVEEIGWTHDMVVPPRERDEPGVRLSLSRTVGVWLSALLTLCIFSFLYGDNPLYRFAEAIFVGVSAGYVMVVGFWTEIVQNLLGNLVPDQMRRWGVVGLGQESEPDWSYLAPLVLSVMMLWRLAPKGGWIARWPLAFFIGATAGFRLLSYFESDFVRQIEQTILPLVATRSGNAIDWETTIGNLIVVTGVMTALTYFFFSVEHTGAVGRVARVGIWMLMITFGASFAYTVMGRIALLVQRLQFLFDDWLWLIDPLGRRMGL